MSSISHPARGHYRRVHRYSNARRDRWISLGMLMVGGVVFGLLLFLILTK